MSEDRLQQLVEEAKSGTDAAVDALTFHLRSIRAPGDVLVAYMASEWPGVRRAAVQAAHLRSDGEVVAALVRLAHDPEVEVRLAVANLLAARVPDGFPDASLRDLLLDDSSDVRGVAAKAAARRRGLDAELALRLQAEPDWEVRLEIANALGGARASAFVGDLVRALAADADADVARACATAAEGHLKRLEVWRDQLDPLPLDRVEEAQKKVQALGADRFPTLVARLQEVLRTAVSPERLREFGTDLTAEAEAGRLPRAHGVDSACEAVVRILKGPAPRSAVLLGPPGCGKTAVVNEVVHRLREDAGGPWRVVRIQPSELLVGTVYIGEWQTKLRKLIEAAAAPRRVLLYVPNLHELAWVGRASQSELNVATMLAPHVENGTLAILGESTPEAFRSGLGSIPSLRRLFAPVEVREATPDETRAILRSVRGDLATDLADADLERLMELASFYMPGTAEPGRAVGLLRRVAERGAEVGRPVAVRDVLETLSQSTGVPVDFLDDAVPLDLAKVRAFFEKRVMGQPDAVSAVVNLVSLVKAGLTDPQKPYGVMLFIGPTGVGKTEMARALAELLFGDAGRLVRFDMSEFATADAHERLIGWPTKPGLLTSAVRDQPFSVVLFDEVEKAHLNVFDLFLQLFDAGRLTDAQGRTADFRRSILIMTSNIGSAVATESAVGFGAGPPPLPDTEDALREVGRFFRPEFVNRIDQIVMFRALSPETAEQIARRELARVLERGGIARRRLAVDVDPAVVSLLLRHGYSPAFGARPLKRTVERFVLLPVARAIAEGTVPSGSVLRLEARGDQVRATVVPPEGADEDAGPAPARDAPPALRRRVEALEAQVAEHRRSAAPLEARKADLFAQTRSSDLWKDKAAARLRLEEFRRCDSILESLARLERRLAQVSGPRLVEAAGAERQRRLHEVLDGLERESRFVGYLLGCREPRELGDAFVTVSLVKTEGPPLDAVRLLGEMYLGFARRKQLETEVLDDHRIPDPTDDAVTILVAGPGAFGLLAAESGIHQVTRSWTESGSKGRRRTALEVVRVEVFPVPAEDAGSLKAEVRQKTRAVAKPAGRFLAAPVTEVSLLHAPSMTSVRVWTRGRKEEAVDRALPILQARLAGPTLPARPRAGGVVRRYALGPSARVRDRRTGVETGHADRVLKGEIDVFLFPDGTSA